MHLKLTVLFVYYLNESGKKLQTNENQTYIWTQHKPKINFREDITRKENYSVISFMNTDINIFNKLRNI